ncbi:MAG TPA: sulfatase-like hydrolase/transferase, partial [Solirubrobacteraceae bacterium]|nr:sulfatase-like hydrolase/transferase [Solirubrobacteraceae bacterium]
AGVSVQSARPIVEALRDRLLAEVLRRSGYRTGAVSANTWVSTHSGFATGFERFVERLDGGRPAQMSTERLGDRLRWMASAARARSDDGAAAAAATLEQWAAEPAPAPFFWFVNLVECHSPYLPPRPYAALRAGGRMRAALEASEWLNLASFWRTCVTREAPEEPVLERMRSGYRGAIAYMDAWLGRVLEALDAAGQLEDTLVIVSSDHGENFGEGGLIGHGFSLDERLMRVPFVAAGPGAERLEGIRSLAEVPGRLAAIAGVPEHPYDPSELPPLPVAQFDSPAPGLDDPRTQRAIALWNLDEAAAARLVTPIAATTDGTVKLVVRGGREEFYDLERDPSEREQLAAAAVGADAAARLRAALAHPAATASVARRVEPAPAAAEDPELAELEDRMRLLGYL